MHFFIAILAHKMRFRTKRKALNYFIYSILTTCDMAI